MMTFGRVGGAAGRWGVVAATVISSGAWAEQASTPAELEQKRVEKTRADLQVVLETAAIDRAERKLAEQARDRAREAEAQTENAKLLKLGISLGMAAGLEFPIGTTDEGTGVRGPSFVAMPYVILLPWYWWATTDASNEYCASEWSGNDRQTARTAAYALARRSAERQFQRILDAFAAGATDEEITTWANVDAKDRAEFSRTVKAIRHWWGRSAHPSGTDEDKASLISWLAEFEWNSNLDARCMAKKWGAYFGRPIDHPVMAKVAGAEPQTRTFVPQLSFGLTFTPNAYVSILLGATVGAVEVPGGEGAARDPKTAWAGMFALGGNLDLAAALVKGLAK